jgi:hypothetical protein
MRMKPNKKQDKRKIKELRNQLKQIAKFSFQKCVAFYL